MRPQGLSFTRVMTMVRAVGAGQLETAVDLVDVARQAAAADVGRADAELAQPPGEALLVPGGGVEDAERAGERGLHRAVQREEGDLRVDLGHGAVGVRRGRRLGRRRRGGATRARSSTRPARVTAGFGSSRYSPGSVTGTGSPGQATRACEPEPDSTSARRGPPAPATGAVARAGDQRTASLRSRPSAMNSASQPSGIRPAGRPGAALTQTAGTRSASAKHQSSGGSDWPALNRWAAPASATARPSEPAGRAGLAPAGPGGAGRG